MDKDTNFNIANFKEKFNIQTQVVKDKNPKMYECLKVYFTSYIKSKSRMKNKESRISDITRVVRFLIDNVHKDLSEYSNTEIKTLVNSLPLCDRGLASSFLKDYCSKNSCVYSCDYDVLLEDDRYLSVDEAAKLLKVATNNIFKYCRTKIIKDSILYKQRRYVNKEEILEMGKLLGEDYVSTVEASKILGMTPQHTLKLCKDGVFEKSTMHPTKPNQWLLFRKELEDYINSDRYTKDKPTNPLDLFKYLTKSYINEKPTLYNAYLMYTTNKINNANNEERKRGIANLHASTYIKLISILQKDLELYTDDEVIVLSNNTEFNSKQTYVIALFLNYYRVKNKSCNFSVKITPKRVKIGTKTEKNKPIYTFDEWTKYYINLNDIDRHIQKAMESPKYANIWLYCMLHQVMGWRSSDFKQLPNVDIEVVNIYDFNWFQDNDFLLSMGESLLDIYRSKCIGVRTKKTIANAHLVIPADMIIPVSIALIINEIHRRNLEKDILLFTFKSTMPKNTDFKKFFNDKNLNCFQSLKANRSLLTHGFNFAVTNEGDATLAYSYSVYLRSHKNNKRTHISNMTKQYIYSSDKDGSLDDVTFSLFRRGHFGWLYHKIVQLTIDDDVSLSLKEETNTIVALRESIDVAELETLSGFLRTQQDERVSVIQELLKLNKDELKLIVSKLAKGEMPSKMKHCQCLISGKCIYPLASTCLGCKYVLPMNYVLVSLYSELITILDKLIETPEHKTIERVKYTNILFKLLSILNDAKLEYNNIDETYLDRYIDFNTLQTKVIQAQKNYYFIE